MTDSKVTTWWDKAWTVVMGMATGMLVVFFGMLIGGELAQGTHDQSCVEMLIALDSVPQAVIEHCTDTEEGDQ